MRLFLTGCFLMLALTAAASPRREDMRADAARIAEKLEQYGSFEEWSAALQPMREKFYAESGKRLSVNPLFGNFAAVMQSVHAFCDEYGIDFIAVRQPTPEERAFYQQFQCGPDPYVFQLQQELLKNKVEFVEPLVPDAKPLAVRLRERYPLAETGRKILFFGDPAEFPGIPAEFRPVRNGGAYFAAELSRLEKTVLQNRPAIVFAVPAALLYRELAVLPHRDLVRIPVAAYEKIHVWGAGSWHKLGVEPLPEKDSAHFKLLPDGTLQLAPLLAGETSGMAGTVTLPLPEPPGRAVRIELFFAGPADVEVRAFCGRDSAIAGTVPDGKGAKAEVRLRPVWLSRILSLKFFVKGKVKLREIRLYRANFKSPAGGFETLSGIWQKGGFSCYR